MSGAFSLIERILQVLIAHMAEGEPQFLERLRDVFAIRHVLGANEQDFTATEDFAAQFIRQIDLVQERNAV